MPSSTTTALSRQPLKEVLEGVTDPRDRRGVRHPLVSVLCLAVVGVLAGCRSLTAIWEHAADRQRTPPCRGVRSVFFLAGPRIVNTVISFLVTFSCVFAEALQSTAPVVGGQDARQINKTLLLTGDQRGFP